MDQSKVLAVTKWPVKELQQFLGFANFYQNSIRNYNTVTGPLTFLLKGKPRTLHWSESSQEAFNLLKNSFTTAHILRHPDPEATFIVEVDASGCRIGAILSQCHPRAYFSRKLTTAEANYNVGNRELLSIKVALEEWHHWLEGAQHPFLVLTDHHNLEYLRGAKRLNPHQARWALFFTRFNFTVTYRPGCKNGKANALSRQLESNTPTSYPELCGTPWLMTSETMSGPVPSTPSLTPAVNSLRGFLNPDRRGRYILYHLDAANHSDTNNSGVFCRTAIDGIGTCWPRSVAGQMVSRPCPEFLYGVRYNTTNKIFRKCLANGTWASKSNYSQCKAILNVQRKSRLHYRIAVIINYLGHCLSLFTLLIAFVIFLRLRSIRCLRNIIHWNLISAFILRNATWFIVQHTMNPDVHESNVPWCRLVTTAYNYFHMANFFWMFGEGCYLHTAIVLTYSTDKLKKWMFICIGWCIPFPIIVAWAIGKLHYDNEKCWFGKRAGIYTDYIYQGPMILVLMINFVFLFNIVRILMTKLRASTTSETIQYRKAVKATLVLLPLLGITYMLFFVNPGEDEISQIVFIYFNSFLQSFQGAGGNWATVGRRSRRGRRVHRQREKRKGKSVGLRIGTLNVGTMTGKGRELADVMERRKVDILCVQETRWKGSKARSIGAGFKLFYYGVDSKRNGVGVVLKEEFVRNVLEVKRVSDRVMSLKLEIKGVMLNVVSGYAPQVGCELEEKERFWSELDEVMESIPTGERVVIGADFNGHVGEGNTGDEEVMGKFGVKERNLEGQMVVDFAKRMDMAVVNTYFQKREEHRVTYMSGGRRTQVDYILCRRGNLKEISDCKVVVGESVARQHRMVVCRMTLKVCKTKRSEIEKKTKWWKLEKEECCEEFRQKLRQTLGGQVLLPDDWETTAEVIRETGRKVLGVSSGRRKENKETWWWNEEVQDSVQRKRLAKKKWDMDRTEENRQEYKELQHRVKREVSKAKQKAYDELYTRLDTREGEKDLYRLARQRDRDGKDVQQVRVIKDRDGRVLTSEESVQRRWKEYFEELMNEENEREKE
ncbi:hypothetical protein QTP86_003662 [Hemibagrus guttatus]|nr:hypothetical protein QTP86_003662 [Hemibagrus guttatus]